MDITKDKKRNYISEMAKSLYNEKVTGQLYKVTVLLPVMRNHPHFRCMQWFVNPEKLAEFTKMSTQRKRIGNSQHFPAAL